MKRLFFALTFLCLFVLGTHDVQAQEYVPGYYDQYGDGTQYHESYLQQSDPYYELHCAALPAVSTAIPALSTISVLLCCRRHRGPRTHRSATASSCQTTPANYREKVGRLIENAQIFKIRS